MDKPQGNTVEEFDAELRRDIAAFQSEGEGHKTWAYLLHEAITSTVDDETLRLITVKLRRYREEMLEATP
jgi:hypothetical protein